MERAPQISHATIAANLDHAFVVFAGAANDTAAVDTAIRGSGIERISRVAFERCVGHPESTVALFRGWDGVDELLCPVLSLYDFSLFSV